MNRLTITPEQLTSILQMFKVDMSEGGTEGRADVHRLLKPLQNGEGALRIDKIGIALVLTTVRALIKNERGEVLIVGYEKRYGKDNRNLAVANLPGGKVGKDEDGEDEGIEYALERELNEEAGLRRGRDYTIGGYRKGKGPKRVLSLPNLQADITKYIFEVTLNPGHRLLTLLTFEYTEGKGHKLLFKWIPETEWLERQDKMN